MTFKINFIAVFVIVVFCTVGCSDKLEEIIPQQSFKQEEAFANEARAVGATIGIYGLMQDVDVYGSLPQVIAEYQSDNVSFAGSFPSLQQINNYATLSSNSSIGPIYRDTYEPILAANAVITNVPDVPGEKFTKEERNQLIGEARFLRALCYFNLVNLFAQPFQIDNGANDGVPLVTEPFVLDIERFPRSTVNEVHAQIKADLDSAIRLLPDDNLAPDRASVGAARLMLSRLHLYRGEWAEAATQAAFITGDRAKYAPATNYLFWKDGGSEFLFSRPLKSYDWLIFYDSVASCISCPFRL